MILPGHLAAGYLAAHYCRLDERVAVVAALLPDLVDKTGRYVLQISESGRVPAHSILMAIATTVFVGLLMRRPAFTTAWAIGYLSHLATDVVTDWIHFAGGSDYLLWPFWPVRPGYHPTLLGSIATYSFWTYGLEATLTAWAIVIFWRKSRRRKSAGEPALGSAN